MFKIVHKEGDKRERERWNVPEEGYRKWRKWIRKIKTQEEIMYAHIDKKEVKLDLRTKKVSFFFNNIIVTK